MAKKVEFGRPMRSEFMLEPGGIFLNNGAKGAPPTRVINHRLNMIREMESQPDIFFRYKFENYWLENRQAISEYLGSHPDNLVFVSNATTGVNCVLRSLPLQAGDAILCYTYQFRAVYNACCYVARTRGAEILVLDVRPPITSPQEIVDKYDKFLQEHPNVKVAALEYISCTPAIKWPVKELAAVCRKHGVLSLIDGAHTPNHIKINLEQLGVDFYVGNLHKWCFVPRGCAILWVHPDHHSFVRPNVTSNHLDGKKLYEDFYRQGTRDETGCFSTKAALEFIKDIGGLDAVTEYCKNLADKAADLLVERWGTRKFEIPPEMEAPFLRMIRLPDLKKYPVPREDPNDILTALGDIQQLIWDIWERFHIQCLTVFIHGEPWLRLSIMIYNTIEDVEALAQAILAMKDEN